MKGGFGDIYVINLPLIFEAIVLKIELPERSEGMWLTCQRIIVIFLSHFCHICHRLVSQGRVPSAQVNVTLHGREYPGMAWKIDIRGVFYVLIIPYILRLN